MSRRNGIGTILLGRISDQEIAPARVKLLWFTVFFVPVLPIRAYAVTGGMDGYYFHGEMGLWAFLRRYKWRVFPYLITMLVEAVLGAVLVITIAVAVMYAVARLFGRA